MDWKSVLSSDAEEVEKNEELLEKLYSFFLQTDLPKQGEPLQTAAPRLYKYLWTKFLPLTIDSIYALTNYLQALWSRSWLRISLTC